MPARIPRIALGLAVASMLAPHPASALPAAAVLLADLGFSPAEIAKVEAGEFVRGTVAASSPRELAAAFAFRVDVSPETLVHELRSGLLVKVDPTVTTAGEIHAPATLADFAKLTLAPDPAKRAAVYTGGSSDLNLSTEEIAAFRALTSPADVEQQVRRALLARVESYRAKGLTGIAPYGRDGGTRAPADELRSAVNAMKKLDAYAPAAHQLLLDYPAGKPPGFDETFRWTQFDAHGVPTIALTHGLYVPDGAAYLVAQRQFYVSTGYNCEQAIAAFVPTGSGTIVIYANRTSTDQIEGLGGGAKRSIGSKLLASQLEEMFEKLRSAAKGP